MKRNIFVTFQKEGIHKYPDAPAGVEFLKNEHRHMFHFKVIIEVFHNDRDIEFILFKRELEGLYDKNEGVGLYSKETETGTYLKLNHQSCEMMAEALYLYINKTYPNRDVTIEVSEDGENGAIIQWEHKSDWAR